MVGYSKGRDPSDNQVRELRSISNGAGSSKGKRSTSHYVIPVRAMVIWLRQ
jgi:hypothetical protein